MTFCQVGSYSPAQDELTAMLNSPVQDTHQKYFAGVTVSPGAPGDKEHGVLAVQFFLCTWIKAWVAEQTLLS